MTKQDVSTAAMALDPAERIELAEQLFFSISDSEQGEIDAAWLAEVQRRDAAYQRGETTAHPVEEFLARLKARKQ